MPAEAMQVNDAMSFRYYDYPRPGSIYRMLDDTRLVRGPTYVRLPSGADIQVPAQMKIDVVCPAQVHDNKDAKTGLQELVNMLQGKRGNPAPQGFRTGGRFDRPAQTPLLHPREHPRRAGLAGQDHAVHF